jgi:hypothetical protein
LRSQSCKQLLSDFQFNTFPEITPADRVFGSWTLRMLRAFCIKETSYCERIAAFLGTPISHIFLS